MYEPIEEAYFNWLCAKVASLDPRVYSDLLKILYEKEFVWIVPNDENRVQDGLELRDQFLLEARYAPDEYWQTSECSILEVLIAFANRAWFQTDTPPRDWFWTFIKNLELDEFRNPISDSEAELIDELLTNFVWRTYSNDGHGGLFPIHWPKHDQRRVEIWYQFCEYLEDSGLL